MFSDEGDAEPGAVEVGEVVAGADPGLGDDSGGVGEVAQESDGVVEVGGHGAEVSVVDPEDGFGAGGGEGGESSWEVGGIVDLEEDPEVVLGGAVEAL